MIVKEWWVTFTAKLPDGTDLSRSMNSRRNTIDELIRYLENLSIGVEKE